jgi:hypothetical protein
MNLKITLAALLASGALVAAGCGDDDDDTTTTSTTTAGATGATGTEGAAGILPADFAAEADAICKAGDAEIDAEAEAAFGDSQQEPSQAEQEEFVTDAVLPGIQDQVDGLRALGDPEEGSEEFTAFLDDAQEALDTLEDDPSALFGEGGDDPFADVEDQAKELGLSECAS